ncbi:hypothetical protein SCLCIDRAFT_30183 [Scleroderma citrinum Foug A]|uniref:Uncharacterized protein n=1 Tax=Scleroderma citrinum Foug A TaxID=1036808 RepID=A0A0C2Z1E1_9AGAM|nr:hypothetical protein SCLCIDRAFT_30183 [Scleroderma citrinum Foug A]
MHQMVAKLAKAYRNQSIEFRRLAEDLGHKESGVAVDQEAAFLVKHPTGITPHEGFPPVLDKPTIILGEGDTIVLWYLPGALANNTQKQMLSSLESLPDALQKSIVGRNWRTNPDYFRPESLSGCLEFAPTIHQLGHSAWTDIPSISTALKTESGLAWASKMSYPSAILSAALSIMHPLMYNARLHGMETLSAWAAENDELMGDALADWSTVYTNISLIANQGTPFHHDPHSRSEATQGWHQGQTTTQRL